MPRDARTWSRSEPAERKERLMSHDPIVGSWWEGQGSKRGPRLESLSMHPPQTPETLVRQAGPLLKWCRRRTYRLYAVNSHIRAENAYSMHSTSHGTVDCQRPALSHRLGTVCRADFCPHPLYSAMKQRKTACRIRGSRKKC